MYVYIYIYIYTHTHIYIYHIYIFMHILLQPPSNKVLNSVNRTIYIYFGFAAKATIIGHCTLLLWINSNRQMATVYLVLLSQ